MKFTIDKRGNFKTTNLIKHCFAENQKKDNLTYIVCPNKLRARAVANFAKQLGIDIPFPMAMNELFDYRSYGKTYIKNILIDDIDLWLKERIPFNILEVTASVEESEEAKIQAMAKILNKDYCGDAECNNCNGSNYCSNYFRAKQLYDAGYRK